MAITLVEQVMTAHTRYDGKEDFTVAAGKTLTIETTPAGEEFLAEVVPAGKQWAVRISINIIETDA